MFQWIDVQIVARVENMSGCMGHYQDVGLNIISCQFLRKKIAHFRTDCSSSVTTEISNFVGTCASHEPRI